MDSREIANIVVALFTVPTGVFGNSLVFLSVKRFEWLKTPTNCFVALLAFYDFCNGLPTFIFYLFMLDQSKEHGINRHGYEICCKAYVFITAFCGLGNLLSVMVVTVDRYIYINWPLRYPTLVTNGRATVVAIVSFILGLIGSSLAVLGRTVQKPCNTIQIMHPFVIIYGGLPTFLLAIILVAVLYGKIAILAFRTRTSNPNPENISAVSGLQKKTTRTISLVIGVFMMTYLIYFAVFISSNGIKSKYVAWIQVVSIWIWRVSFI